MDFIDNREEETKAIAEHKQKRLEQRAQIENTVEVEGQANQNNTKSLAKLLKLPITKFNEKIEAWLPFWGKFNSEIDSTNLPTLTKFSYLKELLEESVRADVDGRPFTEDGYSNAKAILEAEYGQTTEVVDAYVQKLMSLPVVDGADPKRINDFFKQLRNNVHGLETLGKLADVKGNVRSTLDKLKGIKADLVRGNEGGQEWDFNDLLKELKKWREINSIDENIEKIPQRWATQPSFEVFSRTRFQK